jgi:hypothetical protein
MVTGTVCSLRFGHPKEQAQPSDAAATRKVRDKRRCIEGNSSVPGPEALARRWGHLCTDAGDHSFGPAPKRARIAMNPRLSPRFQALVPEMERDHWRFQGIPQTTEAPRVQGFSLDGARETRTPDLLGAIQQLGAGNRAEKNRCCSLSRVALAGGSGSDSRGSSPVPVESGTIGDEWLNG